MTSPALRYLSFIATAHSLDLERSARSVLYMSLDRSRLITACFDFGIGSDELRAVVSELRRMGQGLERWIVPALERTSLARAFREDNPTTYAIVPELLASCRDLPVADHWKRVRANVIAHHAAEQDTPVKKARRNARRMPRK